jgi:hypothetical protein
LAAAHKRPLGQLRQAFCVARVRFGGGDGQQLVAVVRQEERPAVQLQLADDALGAFTFVRAVECGAEDVPSRRLP